MFQDLQEAFKEIQGRDKALVSFLDISGFPKVLIQEILEYENYENNIIKTHSLQNYDLPQKKRARRKVNRANWEGPIISIFVTSESHVCIRTQHDTQYILPYRYGIRPPLIRFSNEIDHCGFLGSGTSEFQRNSKVDPGGFSIYLTRKREAYKRIWLSHSTWKRSYGCDLYRHSFPPKSAWILKDQMYIFRKTLTTPELLCWSFTKESKMKHVLKFSYHAKWERFALIAGYLIEITTSGLQFYSLTGNSELNWKLEIRTLYLSDLNFLAATISETEAIFSTGREIFTYNSEKNPRRIVYRL
jgi:hypothetical protein